MRRAKGGEGGGEPEKGEPPRRRIRYSDEESSLLGKPLSIREGTVEYWVARGKDNEEIAGILHISADTVRTHVQRIREKRGGESRLNIIATYWQRQIDRRNAVIRKLWQRRHKKRPP